ncbi:hypothetical protein Droror1_Dr00024427 [Drosera rotundifolia]
MRVLVQWLRDGTLLPRRISPKLFEAPLARFLAGGGYVAMVGCGAMTDSVAMTVCGGGMCGDGMCGGGMCSEGGESGRDAGGSGGRRWEVGRRQWPSVMVLGEMGSLEEK